MYKCIGPPSSPVESHELRQERTAGAVSRMRRGLAVHVSRLPRSKIENERRGACSCWRRSSWLSLGSTQSFGGSAFLNGGACALESQEFCIKRCYPKGPRTSRQEKKQEAGRRRMPQQGLASCDCIRITRHVFDRLPSARVLEAMMMASQGLDEA